MLYLNITVPYKIFTSLYLTLTNVVFEWFYIYIRSTVETNLTLTNVVFELKLILFYLNRWINLNLKNVVFELVYQEIFRLI